MRRQNDTDIGGVDQYTKLYLPMSMPLDVLETVHVFTSSGNFVLSSDVTAQVLVVAGGGGGGSGDYGGGGGGAGGLLTSSIFLTAGTKSVTVGGGGAGASTYNTNGSSGENSVFESLTAIGGGYGAGNGNVGGSGGSGGGGNHLTGSGGTGTSGQGYNGGSGGTTGGTFSGGGGGGASAAGENSTGGANYGGNGGEGLVSNVTGSSVVYASGGGGGNEVAGHSGVGGTGAGNGAQGGSAGTSATGYGCGGGGGGLSVPMGSGFGGIVIIRYSGNAVATGGTITTLGDTSTIIPDKSSFGNTITCSGNAKLVKTIYKHNGSSCSFDGSNSYLSIPDNDLFTIGTQDFVIDAWVYLNSYGANNNYATLCEQYESGSKFAYFGFFYSGGIDMYLYNGGNVIYAYTADGVIPLSTWFHVAYVRSGSNGYLYLNGISQSYTLGGGAWNNSVPNYSAPLWVGHSAYAPGYTNGYISDFRMSVGTDRGWTTPTIAIDTPNMSITTEKNIVEYTKLWIPGYGANGTTDIKDRSAYGRVITVYSGVSISTSQSNFNGSSIYNNDGYSSIPYSTDLLFGTNNFVISCWVYFSNVSFTMSYKTIFSQAISDNDNGDNQMRFGAHINQGFSFEVVSGGSYLVSLYEGTQGFAANTWYHLIAVRSGNTWSIYRNGVRKATNTYNITYPSYSASSWLGRAKVSSPYQYWFNGYISDFVIVNGSSLGISGTTCSVPSKPFSLRGVPQRSYTPVPYDGVADGIDKYTKLYLPLSEPGNAFTDKSFYGKTVTVTNAVSSATQSKFGGSSCYFDGSGDLLSIPDSGDWFFDTDSFVIDFWVYPTSLTNYSTLYEQYVDSNNQLYIFTITSGEVYFYVRGSSTNIYYVNTPASTLAVNAWIHLAFVRSGSNFYIYANGVSKSLTLNAGSASNSFPNYASVLKIGYSTDNNSYFTGYIQEYRIAKGTDRGWTGSTIPVPTRPAQIPQRIANRDMQSSVSTVANPVLYIKGDSYTDSSTNIYDSSPYARAITNTNVVTRIINQKYGPSSLYFNGSSELSLLSSNDWSFGTNNFVIDLWVYRTNTTAYATIAQQYESGVTLFEIFFDASHLLYFYIYSWSNGTIYYVNTTSAALTLNCWTYLALVRSGSNFYIYSNGVKLALTLNGGSAANSFPNINSAFKIGHNIYDSVYFTGYLDEYRITNGSDLGYTGATIPVPQGPYKFK